jgi:hypothetical protein
MSATHRFTLAGNFAGKRIDFLYGSQADYYLRGRGPAALGQDLAVKRDGKIYEVFEEALRRYLEETSKAEASREEPRDYRAYEWQPRPRIPLLFGGRDPTLGERFEEELYPS